MQIKIIMQLHSTSTSMVKVGKTDNTNIGKDVEHLDGKQNGTTPWKTGINH